MPAARANSRGDLPHPAGGRLTQRTAIRQWFIPLIGVGVWLCCVFNTAELVVWPWLVTKQRLRL